MSVAAILGLLYSLLPPGKPSATFTPLKTDFLIGHAGGGLEVGTYSNSLEAMTLSAKNGLRYIEVDLLQVRNGDWVLIHDWGKTHSRYFSAFPRFPAQLKLRQLIVPESAAAFKAKAMRYDLTPLTLDDLIIWMRANPDIAIITDIKGPNLEGLKAIKEALQGQVSQIIPQIYTADEYEPVRVIGFERIIFTAYRSSMSAPDILEFARDTELFAVTVPHVGLAEDSQAWLAAMPVPVLTHTVNDAERAADLMEWGVSGFYTDYLIPN
ncbi:MAG: hypothetical protein AAGK66_07945 [Pseudomonadota bacterium]